MASKLELEFLTAISFFEKKNVNLENKNFRKNVNFEKMRFLESWQSIKLDV